MIQRQHKREGNRYTHAGNGFGVGLPFRIGDRKKKERPISSILDVCGTTRTGTDLRQYNLRFLELHSICRGYCRRERQPSSRSSSNYGSIQTCLSRSLRLRTTRCIDSNIWPSHRSKHASEKERRERDAGTLLHNTWTPQCGSDGELCTVNHAVVSSGGFDYIVAVRQ